MDSAFEMFTPALESDLKAKWTSSETPLLDDKQKKRYQALIGSLLYLMHATRPDLAFSVIRLSQFASCPRLCHWEALKRVLRYLKGTASASLMLGNSDAPPMDNLPGNDDPAQLIGYFDAAHNDNADNRSTCGYLFTLFGSPISWTSKVQRTVALSTTEAELMAGTEAAREAIWIRGLTDALFGTLCCELRGDNQGSLALTTNPVYHQRTKHIALRHRFICDLVNDGVISVKNVASRDMLADSFTKPLPRDLHAHHCALIGLRLHRPDDAHVDKLGLTRKMKIRCDDCGNLFADEAALHKHKLKKEM